MSILLSEGTLMWGHIIGVCLFGFAVTVLLLKALKKLKRLPRRVLHHKRRPYYKKKKKKEVSGKPVKIGMDYSIADLESKPYFLFFDTETTGLAKDFRQPASAGDNWPRLLQLSWIITDTAGQFVREENHLVKPEGFDIPEDARKVNGITTEYALENGENIADVLAAFRRASGFCCACIGHNIRFDQMVVGSEFLRAGMKDVISGMTGIDTMESSKKFCNLHKPDGTLKRPKLQELYTILFGEEFKDAHDAMADVMATKACFEELLWQDVIRIAGYNYQIDND